MELVGIIIVFFFFLVLFFVSRKKKRSYLEASLDMVLFSVKLPRYEKIDENRKEEEKKLISGMEQFYANFLYLNQQQSFLRKFFYGSPRVVFEIASEIGQSDISFYVAVPSSYENQLSKYIQGVYSGAVVEKVPEDYTVFKPGGSISASHLTLKNTFFLPFNIYEELGRDSLEPIVNSVSRITKDEGAAVQIIIRPTSIDLNKKGNELLSKIINENKSWKEALHKVNAGSLGQVIDFAREGSAKKKETESKIKVDETIIQAVRNKIKKPVFETNIRLIGVAQNKTRADEILGNLEGSFSQFSSGFNGFNFKRVKRNPKSFVYDFSFRNFNKNNSILLNTAELASVYHFPLSHIESPHIKWVKTKESAPPSDLPETGLINLGQAVYRDEKKEVFVSSQEDRRRHFYVIGQTGTGKSTLLREMIRQDLIQGRGLGVIDPHGELIESTLANLPKERIQDVVLFEPFDRERPCGLNMLEWETPEQKDFAVSEMVTIFSHLFPAEFIGPMFEYYMRNAMAAIMADKDNPGTIVEIPRIFTDNNFMEEKLSKVSDHIVRNFWLKEWRQTTGQTRSDMLGYVVSKIGRFITDEMMRNIIGQTKSGFNLEEIMDSKKIFLANLSKGLTGEINSSLLGLILVSKMQIAALRRARISEDQRSDFHLYIDEFQNFTTPSVATILSEARKYRLNLILAHQYMPQLKDEIKDAVIGNVGTMVSYRIGAVDAEFLEKQFLPEFSRFDLSNLDNFQYIIKMIINGKVVSPFKVKAPMFSSGDKEIADLSRQFSKAKYGRPRNLVEAEIMERARL